MKRTKTNLFAKLGNLINKRKHIIILAWIVILALVLPFILNEGNVVTLQEGSASGNGLESVQANNIISSQFAKTVSNSSLVIVVSATNVSSLQTQAFIERITSDIEHNSSISGIENVMSVYSILIPTLNSTNQATYAVFDNANMTYNLVYGVPAQYFEIWNTAFNQTQSVAISTQTAYNQTANTLPASALPLLQLFNAYWNQSFQSFPNPKAQNYTLIQRAVAASNHANEEYVNGFPASSKDFGTALIHSFSLLNFLTNSPLQTSQELRSFALGFMSNSSGLSVSFVNSTYSLGRSPNISSLKALAGNIVWKPSGYEIGPQLDSLVSSLVSSSKNATLVTINLSKSENKNLLAIRAIVRSDIAVNSDGVISALVTGGDAIDYDFGISTGQDLEIILPVTIILLLVATGLFFRSVITPIITLGGIGIGLGISQIFIVIIGTYINKVDFMIPTILLTVLIGVGTDYSIFIIARHREERIRHLSIQDAIVKSVTWAGESIATSGATVIISFLALSVSAIVLLQTLGLIVGLGVIVALCVALTFVPALVIMLGEKAFWPNSGNRFQKYAETSLARSEKKSGYFAKSGAFSVKRAKILIIMAILVTVPLLYVYLNTTPSYDFLAGAPNSLESISASKTLASSFGGGKLFPTYVVATFSAPLVSSGKFNATEMNTLQNISSYLLEHEDVQEVTGPTMPYGSPISYSSLNTTKGENDMFNAILQNIGADNKTALINVNFQIDPYSTKAIDDAQDIRTNLHRNYNTTNGVTGIYVSGATGGILDTKNLFIGQFNIILPVVAVGVALVLFIVLGSLILPLFAVISVLMSIVWTLAVTKLVFQSLFNYGLLFITPLFLFVTLLGLGMDYNIFILTRIREEAAKGQKLNDAIVHAIEQTGGIITAAAIILAGSLGALMLSTDVLLKEIGFAFSFSILIDALVVRTYLVPAVMSTLGKWNWYNPIPYLRRSRSLYEKND